ncbi:MAG: hypothetical protein M0041_06420 [Nitrospiraceae bacterium]|jgi:hypothetical protein|uniref:Uncharacterized protein n=1 Tax=Leptospirillum ferrodiazotrophum TaxID=412449 RepID=C6I0X7_9BACT|nr:MAG: protein of unknown function [Leptospirillum ferrodiazotrophum]MDA8150739.1 hypothetical protein [Nitrospiraceae bacterium]
MQLDSGKRKRFEAILNQKEELKKGQADIKDAIKTLASEMGVKTAVVNRILGLVEKERSKGGIIADEREVVDTAGQIAS